MIQYIYFVKCPNCEDEHFDFFDEAKEFALGCLSQKPIVTQVEVNRNDFGECTDSCDLGTVWSWEDMMKETDAEPAKSVFTKDDLEPKCSKHDAEFDDEEFFFDNNLIESAAAKMTFRSKEDQAEFFKLCSEIGIITGADLKRFTSENLTDGTALLDKLKAYRAELGDDFEIQHESCRKPIPEGMTIEQLVEAMEENEDTVECVGCEELFPKDECFHKEDIGYLCSDCEDHIVKCTWCEDLFDKSECRSEVDLGWLCSRCEAAIKSRGETLTFREGGYWDGLNEKISTEKKTWMCVFDGKEIGTVEASNEEEAYAAMEQKYPEYHYGMYDGVATVHLDEDLAELAEIPEVSNSHIRLCPECGKETFDIETGICVDCGFN